MRPKQDEYTVDGETYYSLKRIAQISRIATITARFYFREHAIKAGGKYFVRSDIVNEHIPNLLREAIRKKSEKTLNKVKKKPTPKKTTSQLTPQQKSEESCRKKHKVLQ
ncbi:MAG: hypothetical protein ACRC2T_12185 [Thermoguttaceae bacterium]